MADEDTLLARPRQGRLLQALAQRREELRALIAERRAALERHAAGDDTVEDAVDTAFHRSSAEVESGLIEHYLREIAQVEAAEARAGAGALGICVDCESPIDSSRLRANPAALRCLDCQARSEAAAAPGARRIAQS